MSGIDVITDKTVDAVLDALDKKGYEQEELTKTGSGSSAIRLTYREYRVLLEVRVTPLSRGEEEEEPERRCTCKTCTCTKGA